MSLCIKAKNNKKREREREKTYLITDTDFLFSVPKFTFAVNSKMNQVELQLEDGNKIPPSMCIQYEQKGRCQVSDISALIS